MIELSNIQNLYLLYIYVYVTNKIYTNKIDKEAIKETMNFLVILNFTLQLRRF